MAKRKAAAEGFDPRNWMTVNVTLERARDSIGSFDQALGALYRDLSGGRRLRSGALWQPPGKAYSTDEPKWRSLDADFWRERVERLVRDDRGVVRLILRKGQQPLTGSWYFYCHRADVEKLYRVAAAARADEDAPPSPRGPKPVKDWPKCVADERKRLLLAREPLPKADHFRSHCGTTLGHLPDIRDVQKLLAKLRKKPRKK
jgi:hypothetical protein